jgi:hypothetical protein
MLWQELYNQRIAVCHQCDKYNEKLHVCKECGCFLKFKARAPNLHCPLKKWPGDTE